MARPASVPAFDLSGGLASTATLRDGQRMPVLGLGVWRSAAGAETEGAVRDALSVGYRLIDTATLYQNEESVGIGLRASGIPREEVFVTTKVWNDDQGYESTLRACHRSLERLGLAYVDLYLIHWPVAGRRLETWRALQRLRDEGRCRSIGVSNFSIAHLEELRQASSEVPVINQVELHPFVYDAELLEYCRRHGIQVEAYSPLTRGARLDTPAIESIARAHGVSPARVLIRWGLQIGAIEIPKSVHRERIEENARVFDFSLSASEVESLNRLADGRHFTPDPRTLP